MKRTLLLAALFIALGGAAWYALNKKQSQTGSRNSWDMDFAVPNTGDIYKVFIADRNNRTATLERKDGYWLYNGKAHARPSAVSSLMETLAKVNVQYIPPDAAKDVMLKSLAAEGIKVEIYNKGGKLMKCYYVGGVTADEHGTFMMMEGAEQPYVVHIPSFIGQLRVRYLLGDDEWMDRTIFNEKPEEIQSVSIEYPKMKSESFRLEKVKEAEYEVKPFYSTTPVIKRPLRKGVPAAYILSFENLAAESFESDYSQRDSVTALIPFAIVKVKNTSGKEKQVRFWPVEVIHTPDSREYVHRYFAEVDSSAFMVIQERVFGPVFRGYDFFFERNAGSKLPN